MVTEVQVGEIAVRTGDVAAAIHAVQQSAVAKRGTSFKFINSYCIVLASQSADYRKTLTSNSVNFPDGTPLAWLVNLKRKTKVTQKAVRGPEVFERMLLTDPSRDLRQFLLGGTSESLALIEERVGSAMAGANIVGSWAPPFQPVEEMIDEASERIRAANPDLVWVGLGTPKQDFIAALLSKHSDATFVCVGAAFDFLSGTVPEAPRFLRGSGFEWVYRFIKEPRRLWRRYLIGNAQFAAIALRELVR
ncbi:N-acetylglucosaminyldiphosphoundecaprenol N-acetyl-beta-D-mannosaminyltransferase [Microbacterium testaceum]|uniref:WecB/TagA/CpsF family glycosyltransferase n=1 Tax=Microbacterium testaceum TaxID=2033 RepID=UPI0027838643|nr:WecB/TagA/CpsF family glycosyltransferase [Microbacterium testaceum]MDQ1174268.1 N-acetylglucosaminyldiphosphoundecaprenol N-acetyl-beta-D-mannosaminyltransferase [Microbacterium testaceum]